MKSILELEFGECKWPVSDEMPSQVALCKDMPFAPHLFCGAPVADPNDVKCVYCAGHFARAYGGQGKDWHSLEVMLKTVEKNVTYGLEPKAAASQPELPEILSQQKKADVA